MEECVKLRVERMVAQAYRHLGMTDVEQTEAWIRVAMEYLDQDREHYIEVGPPDMPEYRITEVAGVICKLIPLAREVTQQWARDYLRENTTVLSVMVTEKTARYVTATSYAKLYADFKQNSWSNPVYRLTNLAAIQKTLRPYPPRQIRPVATEADWKVYTMLFAVFDRCCPDRPANTVAHKTERAMLAVAHARPEPLQVGAERVIGKVIPLAAGQLHEQLREDHRYSQTSELCLLVGEGSPRYLLKTHHAYHYFRKVIHDDVPGGCSYEPTDQKREITYSFVSPENIRERLDPYFY